MKKRELQIEMPPAREPDMLPKPGKPIDIGDMSAKNLRRMLLQIQREAVMVNHQKNQLVMMLASLATKGSILLDSSGKVDGAVVRLTKEDVERGANNHWALNVEPQADGGAVITVSVVEGSATALAPVEETTKVVL